jgi:hypothetical protein
MDVMLPKVTPLEADLLYPEHPIKVMDQKDCVTRRKTIKFFKMQWSNHSATSSFKAKIECIPLCVPRSSFTHKATNSEINNITSVYYIESYYKILLQDQEV